MHPKPSKHLWPGETDISILGGNRDTKATLSGPFYGEILLVIICDLLCGSCPVGYGIYTGTQCFHHIARQRDIVVSNPGVALCPPRPRAVAGGRNSVLSSNLFRGPSSSLLSLHPRLEKLFTSNVGWNLPLAKLCRPGGLGILLICRKETQQWRNGRPWMMPNPEFLFLYINRMPDVPGSQRNLFSLNKVPKTMISFYNKEKKKKRLYLKTKPSNGCLVLSWNYSLPAPRSNFLQ